MRCFDCRQLPFTDSYRAVASSRPPVTVSTVTAAVWIPPISPSNVTSQTKLHCSMGRRHKATLNILCSIIGMVRTYCPFRAALLLRYPPIPDPHEKKSSFQATCWYHQAYGKDSKRWLFVMSCSKIYFVSAVSGTTNCHTIYTGSMMWHNVIRSTGCVFSAFYLYTGK